MKLPLFSFKYQTWDVALPAVRAYTFSESETINFLEGEKSIPFVFDINLVSKCNANCKYCSTLGGQSDLRFLSDQNFPMISDSDLETIIKQISSLGVKTIFICSNGEPLLNPDRFLKLAERADEHGLQVLTYTNGSTLTPIRLRELKKKKVNLVIKLESLNPDTNDRIIVNSNSGSKVLYKYVDFRGKKIPENIVQAFDIYADERDMLGVETMIINDNLNEIPELRQWLYENFSTAQFLKQVYDLGYVKTHGYKIKPEEDQLSKVVKEVYRIDKSFEVIYPQAELPDQYSYDVRRFINNCVNRRGFPMRLFVHEKGGVYHSSQIVKKSFGFNTPNVISLFDKHGRIDAAAFFRQIEITLNNDEQ
jgi:MoaA/NifB/PqqE/SkfB family radical SAM enzyme